MPRSTDRSGRSAASRLRRRTSGLAGLAIGLACAQPGDPPPDGAGAATPMEAERCELLAQSYIHAPYGEVWQSLTTAEAFGAWHSAPGLTFGAEPGDSVVWGTEDGALYRGVLRALERGTGFEHTFSFTFLEEPEESWVRWEVVEQGEVVFVRVRHDCTGAPGTAAVITDVGWTKSVERLKTLLETGTAMPWPAEGAAGR